MTREASNMYTDIEAVYILEAPFVISCFYSKLMLLLVLWELASGQLSF